MFLHQLLIAQADAAPPAEPGFLMQSAPILLMFVAVYFLMLRPMWKQNKQQQDMLKALKTDDEVVTTGGMYGKIRQIDDKVVTLEISKEVKVKVLRSAIAGRWSPDAKVPAQTTAPVKG